MSGSASKLALYLIYASDPMKIDMGQRNNVENDNE